jgi:transcriptional regulator of arginine metabolism
VNKRIRHGTILKIIDGQTVRTQEDLVSALDELGIAVTQTTISRDIAELGLVKVRDQTGQMNYARPGTSDHDRIDALAQALRTWALDLSASGNLVVAITPSGYADPLAQAIDQSRHPKILGTIAGENTVLIIATEGTLGAVLRRELGALAEFITSA